MEVTDRLKLWGMNFQYLLCRRIDGPRDGMETMKR